MVSAENLLVTHTSPLPLFPPPPHLATYTPPLHLCPPPHLLTYTPPLVQVGAQTETELKEKKLRVEDALNATKAAVEEGIVIGGGCTLLKLAAKVDSVKDSLSNEEQKVRGGGNGAAVVWLCEV